MTENGAISEARRPRAYSYLRFSTAEQLEGDSLRRQTSLAAAYALRHGLELDDTLSFQDLGVSAFRGLNANVGRLGDFLEAVQVGQVPAGSYLLVESLDRISRNHAFDAQHALSNMIMLGVTVVTLLDERIYSREALQKDPMGMMYSIMGFMRANEESAVKSRRLKQAWANKRANIKAKPLTSKAPAWLRFDSETQHFVPLEDRTRVVRRIFDMTLEGAGQHKIAETFNKEGIPTWGRSTLWHRSYIAKILKSSTVVGTLIPHEMEHVEDQDGISRKSRKPQEPVLNYYPSVVPEATWNAIQALQATAGTAPRGRQAHAPISNVLAFLATCPKCGKTMTRVQKGRRSAPSLVCTVAKAGAGCEYKSVRYQVLEDRLIRVLPSALKEQDGINLPDNLEDEIWKEQQTLSALQDEVEILLDNMGNERSSALRNRLREREEQIETCRGKLQALSDRRDAASGRVIGARIDRAIAALTVPEADFDRKEANLALRALFRQVTINWPQARIDLEWQVGGVCTIYGGTGQMRSDPTSEHISPEF